MADQCMTPHSSSDLTFLIWPVGNAEREGFSAGESSSIVAIWKNTQVGRQRSQVLGLPYKEKSVQHFDFMCSMLQPAQTTFLIWSHCQISAGGLILSFCQIFANIIISCCQTLSFHSYIIFSLVISSCQIFANSIFSCSQTCENVILYHIFSQLNISKRNFVIICKGSFSDQVFSTWPTSWNLINFSPLCIFTCVWIFSTAVHCVFSNVPSPCPLQANILLPGGTV